MAPAAFAGLSPLSRAQNRPASADTLAPVSVAVGVSWATDGDDAHRRHLKASRTRIAISPTLRGQFSRGTVHWSTDQKPDRRFLSGGLTISDPASSQLRNDRLRGESSVGERLSDRRFKLRAGHPSRSRACVAERIKSPCRDIAQPARLHKA